MQRRSVEVVVVTEPPGVADAVIEEEDTYLVLSADPDVREPETARLRAFHEAYTAEPAEAGSVVVREGRPLRLLAVVHDLAQDPTWREEWVAAALKRAFLEAEVRGVHILAVPPLGRVHGALPIDRFVVLLREALANSAPRHLELVWLIAPEAAVDELRTLLESGLWR